jgi:hypothetical protein
MEPEPAPVADGTPAGSQGMLLDVVESIYTPGVNTGLATFMFVLLGVLLLNAVGLLLYFGPNVHLIVLLALSLVLTGLMAWCGPATGCPAELVGSLAMA